MKEPKQRVQVKKKKPFDPAAHARRKAWATYGYSRKVNPNAY